MKPFQIANILTPTDFSKTGLLAVEHAVYMARLYGAGLHLLHSIESAGTTASDEESAKQAEKQLQDLAGKLQKEHAISVSTICRRGKPADEVIQAIGEHAIDIVVMGTHGTSGFNELLLGSNAQKIAAACTCPVITIQQQFEKPGFDRIVLPIDDSFYSRQKVDYTLLLAKKYSSKIYLLGLINTDSVIDQEKFIIKLSAVKEAISKAEVPYEYERMEGGNLAEAAMDYSQKVKAGLVVVLSDHESDMGGPLSGAFARQIVNHSHVPVLSIPPMKGIYDSVSLAGSNAF
ncbi:MAG: universal stress protein [Bacteroidia bacterium]